MTYPDPVIAIRDYLRAQSSVTAICAASRIITDLRDVTTNQHYVVVQRSGGPGPDLYVPLAHPRIDTICFGSSRWESVRLMSAVREALHPASRQTGFTQGDVRIVDIAPESEPTPGLSEQGPQGAWPFLFMAWHVDMMEVAVS